MHYFCLKFSQIFCEGGRVPSPDPTPILLPLLFKISGSAADQEVYEIDLYPTHKYSRPNGVFTRSSKRPAIHVYFEYICWKFAGRLLDRVNTL